jgi:hypothetical protein
VQRAISRFVVLTRQGNNESLPLPRRKQDSSERAVGIKLFERGGSHIHGVSQNTPD